MSWASTVPAVIDALLALLRADQDLSSIVHDGQELRDTVSSEVVFVGYQGADEEIVASGSFDRSGLAVSPNRESYSVRCAAIALNGAADVAQARSRVYELFAAVGTQVSSDHTLSGLVLSASPGGWQFTVEQTEGGAVATLTFEIDIDAYTVL